MHISKMCKLFDLYEVLWAIQMTWTHYFGSIVHLYPLKKPRKLRRSLIATQVTCTHYCESIVHLYPSKRLVNCEDVTVLSPCAILEKTLIILIIVIYKYRYFFLCLPSVTSIVGKNFLKASCGLTDSIRHAIAIKLKWMRKHLLYRVVDVSTN